MTIDDSTLVAQAVSSSTKQVRRIIHGSVGRNGLYAAFVLSNVVSAVSRWKDQDLTRASRLPVGYNAAYLNAPIPSFILDTFLIPFLVSITLHQASSDPQELSMIPNMASTAVAASIPLLASSPLGPGGRISGEMLMILAAGVCRIDRLAESFIASTFIAQLDPTHAVWAVFSQFQAVMRYAQSKADGITRPSASEASSSSERSEPNQLVLQDVQRPLDVFEAVSRSYKALLTKLRLWSTQQIVLTLALSLLGLVFVAGRSWLTGSSSEWPSGAATHYQRPTLSHQLFMSSLILTPTLFEAGLMRTVRGGLKVGLGGIGSSSVGILGTMIYTLRQRNPMNVSFGHSILQACAALSCGWIWLYRSKSCLAVTFALSLLVAHLITALIAQGTGTTPVDLSIPFILLRLQLAACPPSPRPAQEAAEEKKKPDPQKGLTPYEERDVDMVLESGWYTALRIVWAAIGRPA